MNANDAHWVWVVVHGPEGDEQLLGQQEMSGKMAFIPCFRSKEEAINGLSLLTKNRDRIHTVQAMLLEDLKHYSSINGFMIFVLNANGEIIDRISPVAGAGASG